MQLEGAYKRIIELDGEEKMGLAYFQETGHYLDFIDLVFLQRQENPYDFSTLSSTAALEHKKDLLSKLESGY